MAKIASRNQKWLWGNTGSQKIRRKSSPPAAASRANCNEPTTSSGTSSRRALPRTKPPTGWPGCTLRNE
jgi:hypothetical protein